MLVVKSGGAAALPEWQSYFAEFAPGLAVRWWDDPALPRQQVRYALVWDPEPGRLAQFPALEVVFGSGAGVDFIVRDPSLPRRLPVVRMAIASAAQMMGEYICWAALSLVNDARRMAVAQARGEWDYFENGVSAVRRRVGIMGLGVMGSACVPMLQALGFPVLGWSRTRKEMPGLRSFAGAAELPDFLAQTDILVCLLPETPATRGLIDAKLLAQLPPGAQLIQAGRGSQAVIPDILAALECGQLDGAVMDVFDPEPLPARHALWQHPRVTITPHVGSLPSRRERAQFVAQAIAAHERGEALPNLYDRERGY